MHALNSTLGFHQVYATYDNGDGLGRTNRTAGHRENLKSIASLLGIDIRFVKATTADTAAILKIQHGYAADATSVAELDTHRRIYADMVANNVQSALIIRSDIDVETDLKMRLANAMSNNISTLYDILFLGHVYSDISEPRASQVYAALTQTTLSSDSSHRQQRRWAKKQFLNRKLHAYRSMHPRGISHAYAISGSMARRLDRRMERRMMQDAHSLDYILADVAMFGLSIAYSVLPPPVALHCNEQQGGQYLSQSALYAMSLRDEDPSKYAPYNDWVELWG